jgi:sarcosine oxidase subunit beta
MKTADVVVIGGGVIGTAIAYVLATQGISNVVLLEKGRFASGSTRQSGGFLRIYHPDSFLSDLAAEGIQAFLRFKEEVGESCGYVRTGLLYLESPERLKMMVQEVERLNTQYGLSLEILTPLSGAKHFSTLNWQGVGGAVYEKDGGYADPILTVFAWVRRARELGVTSCEGTQVEEIIVEKGRVIGVRTTIGIISTPCVVLAAGAWSGKFAASLGLHLPVRSKCIQVHFFKKPSPQISHPTFIDDTTNIYAREEPGCLSLIGYPVEEWDIDPDVSEPANWTDAQRTCEIAAERLPWVKEALLSGGRRSFDAYTPTCRGILRFSSDIRGLMLATGWSGGGFKLAPGVAKRVAKLILSAEF